MKTERVNLGKKGGFSVKEGALHEMLHVPTREKIGQKRIKAATHSRNPLERRRAVAALGMTHMHGG